jgi:hypothetical protein
VGWLLLWPALLSAGCVSKAAADARARAAFLAGQQQAMQRMQMEARQPRVTVLGEVRNAVIPWTADLTLAKVIVAASYYGKTDPRLIIIQRNGQELHYDPNDLLKGQDIPMQPGDVVEIGR